jgi:hypothetical protein
MTGNVLLWVLGVVLIVAGGMLVRGPLDRYRQLQATEANLRRYDEWRGSRLGADGTRTGADEMKDQLRTRIILWGAVVVAGVVALIAGFVVR